MADSSGPGRLAADAMGTRDLVFTVLAALAPLTLVVALAPLHFLKGGAAVPGGYIVAGIVMTLFAVGFMTMARYVRNAGAFYAMISKGLGRPLGSGSATLALLAYNGLQISCYGALGLYAADSFARYTGLDLPWWLFALAGAALVGYLGFRGIHTSARVLAVLLLAEIAILVVLAVFVIAKGGSGDTSFSSFAPGEVLTPGNGAMFALVFGAFMGFEATAIFSEEARGGIRTVRRATYIAVGFIAVFYAFCTWIVVYAVGADQISAAAENDLEGLVIGVYEAFTPGPVSAVMEILLLTSAFAALLALHNAANRYLFSLGREGLVPSVFGKTHPRTLAPHVAGNLQTAVAMIVIVVWAVFSLDPYLGLLLWGSSLGFSGIIALWALCAVAVVVYLRRNHPEVGLWRSTVAPGLSAVALIVVLCLVLANFGLLTGGGTTTNTVLLILSVAAFAGGVISAISLRRRAPERYAALSAAEVESAVPEPV
ncbi:amino acid/polyamine/organocation transporter (APC superfamily) [Actinocorallia herbida]|uniref:Amino acid/polyamine/organocation transporter (APC superfamily) n=1 Tax=Actinocorallia herbida TaxID=58109 RepID=A0A3N1D4Y3_9ACTN|nr:APC family permease [Actinocorallia herbida]ROO88611.1 amino acid/polyamine/organocation transporter (APC superfamily) [Actinocorallia herbida]